MPKKLKTISDYHSAIECFMEARNNKPVSMTELAVGVGTNFHWIRVAVNRTQFLVRLPDKKLILRNPPLPQLVVAKR